jgi:hypothetical protein
MSTKQFPEVLSKRLNKFLTEFGANETEIKELSNSFEESLKTIKRRAELTEKFSEYPVLKLQPCPCEHGCNRYSINGVGICDDASGLMQEAFPKITTEGVNAGILWQTMKDQCNTYDWVDIATKIIIKGFTKRQKALVRRHFKTDFTGWSFSGDASS